MFVLNLGLVLSRLSPLIWQIEEVWIGALIQIHIRVVRTRQSHCCAVAGTCLSEM